MSEEGAPAWMVSFGDMMTLILTFFILLVSMSETQEIGLIAKGVGSFLVATRNFGLPGVMSEADEASIYENVRRRFNLPPEDDPDRQAEHVDASEKELIRGAAEALRPHDEIAQPSVAVFAPDSAILDEASRQYLDVLSTLLRPGPGQSLLLEGHAPNDHPERGRLAFERALAVRDYLVEERGFPKSGVKVRAWVYEIDSGGTAVRSVDARLITPERDPP